MGRSGAGDRADRSAIASQGVCVTSRPIDPDRRARGLGKIPDTSGPAWDGEGFPGRADRGGTGPVAVVFRAVRAFPAAAFARPLDTVVRCHNYDNDREP